MTRYARQQILEEIGDKGQARIADSRIVIVGMGGLGCPAALYLASAGVGHLVLCDHDRVDGSNLSRQVLYTDADVGQRKVDCAARELTRRSPAVQVETRAERMLAESLVDLLQPGTLVVDTSDNYATRLAVNQACLGTRTPWVMGAAIRFEGQVASFRPDRDGMPCYRCVYGEAATSLDDCQGGGVFTPLTGIVGSAVAAEVIRLRLDLDATPRLSLLDARRFEWRQLGMPRRDDCPDCGR